MSFQQFPNSKLSSRWTKAFCIYMFACSLLGNLEWCITSAVSSTKTILPVAKKGERNSHSHRNRQWILIYTGRRQAVWCQRCRRGGRRREDENLGGWWVVVEVEKGKNKQRMKAGAQKHQLKMTAAGKLGRETGETMLEDGKGGKKQ